MHRFVLVSAWLMGCRSEPVAPPLDAAPPATASRSLTEVQVALGPPVLAADLRAAALAGDAAVEAQRLGDDAKLCIARLETSHEPAVAIAAAEAAVTRYVTAVSKK